MVPVEICASTIRDVAVAMEADAHRVELCSVWSVGGITHNVVVVEAASLCAGREQLLLKETRRREERLECARFLLLPASLDGVRPHGLVLSSGGPMASRH